MRILYIHTHFLSHFEPIVRFLTTDSSVHQTFLCCGEGDSIQGVERVPFAIDDKTPYTARPEVRPLERTMGIAEGVYQALPELEKPDLVVSYAGFGCSIHLRNIWPEVPIVGYFPYYYHSQRSEVDFLPYTPPSATRRMMAPVRNCGMLMEHAHMNAGYTPTEFQASRFPEHIRSWLTVLHDGIDCEFWSKQKERTLKTAETKIPDDSPLITYVSRGLEFYRGFDRAIEVISRILRERTDCNALIVGSPRPFYGPEMEFTEGRSLKDFMLDRLGREIERIHFAEWVQPEELARIFSRSALNLYWTVPYTLSWSLLNAMSCETPTLASDTAPIREYIESGKNGILLNFFDSDSWVEQGLKILDQPKEFTPLWKRARETILERCDTRVTLPKLRNFFQDVSSDC